jgi:type I restriction enzyme S subunit
MRRYDSYKDSRVEWIGEIPNEWSVKRMCYLFLPTSIKSTEGEINLSVYRDYGVIPRDSRDDNHNVVSEDTSNYKLVEVGDFVMNKMKCWMGSLGLSEFRGIVSPSYTVMKPLTNDNSRFLHYLLRSPFYIPQYRRLSYGVRIGQWDLRFEDFRDLSCILPPLSEQQQIVSYLDTKTSQIDYLIEKTKRKIDLLKEKRTSLINEVVTKGLNPNVEMKDSGVEWIGEIPSHWEITKGKYILKILTGNYPSEIIEDENGQHFVKVDDLNNLEDGFYLSNPKLKIQDFGMNTLEEGIILFPKRGMTIFTNKVVITKSKCFIDPNLMGVKVFDNFNKIFLFYLLTSRGLGDICDSSTIPQINNKHIYPLEFTNPPLSEQQQIVSYLDEHTQLIDKTISVEERRIELLKEYRQSLISEVVTGKRKVVN